MYIIDIYDYHLLNETERSENKYLLFNILSVLLREIMYSWLILRKHSIL